MIHVSRPAGSEPSVLAEQGLAERDRAIDFYSKQPAESFKFKAYGHPAVRQALDLLFHKKCAYCESYYGATQPVDVEHFRPKGAIDVGGSRQKPGYYWLAADWSNLLPSCIDCNRKRGHGAGDGEERLKLGKANQFPISGRRARKPTVKSASIDRRERPLLLHPCHDRPEQHLSFGDGGLVMDLTERGKKTIEVLGLARPGLVQARKKLALALRGQIKELRRVVKVYNADPSADNEEWVRDKIRTIKAHSLSTEEYSAMCGQIIARELPSVLGAAPGSLA